ncbi:MAG: endonuclease/exonuclease/phosphatase family protein [Bacteroidia bacterium]
MEVFEVVLISLAVTWLIFSVLPFIKSSFWWIRILDFPRIQILILGLTTMLLYIIVVYPFETPDLALLVVLGIALFYQAVKIFPFTIIAKKESFISKHPDPDNTISLLISNVRMKNKDYEKLLALIKKFTPDIVFTAETNNWWLDKIGKIESDYPYSIKYPLKNTYGMLFFSKLKVKDPKINFYIKSDIPSIITEVYLRSGNTIKLYALHPEPPRPNQNTDERDAEILMAGKAIRENNEHALIFGDLNDVGWSRTTKLFRKVSEMLDPRIGRGMYNTYNANTPFFRWPLDHIFHTDHFKLVELVRLPHIGSDHFPIYIKLEYTGHNNGQEAPQADSEDLKEAEEKIEDGRK